MVSAPLPGFFVCQRRQNLGRNRILLIKSKSNDSLLRLLQQKGHVLILSVRLPVRIQPLGRESSENDTPTTVR